jgi:CHAT domain-containing protein
VALGNPNNNLHAAEPEVKEIARRFTPERTRVAFGPQADRRFLRRNAGRADYLHLASHAAGGLFDTDDVALFLADGAMSANDLAQLGRLRARLVAISACQSALSEIAGMPDEAVSIGTAMLGAGATCAVASLWPVDDYATALLMTRLYQEMFEGGYAPPQALRRAQQWLRGLTAGAEAAFLDDHPALAAEGRRRRGGDGTEQNRAPMPDFDLDRPYAHPDFWAAFIAVGA